MRHAALIALVILLGALVALCWLIGCVVAALRGDREWFEP